MSNNRKFQKKYKKALKNQAPMDLRLDRTQNILMFIMDCVKNDRLHPGDNLIIGQFMNMVAKVLKITVDDESILFRLAAIFKCTLAFEQDLTEEQYEDLNSANIWFEGQLTK